MNRYVYRWECADGTSCFKRGKDSHNGKAHVFSTLKSAMVWVKDLGVGYDNPDHKDLVLCMYEASNCYPISESLHKEDGFNCNTMTDWCYEFYADITNRLPISYMTYNDLVTFSKQLRKCKSQKSIKEYLGLPLKYDLRIDEVFHLNPGEYGYTRYKNTVQLVRGE